MAKFCISCGKELPEGAVACPNCGASQNANPQPQVVANNAQQSGTNGLAIAGFIVSLVSLVLCCGSASVISLVLSIIGSVKAKNYDGNGKGFAIAGIIISAVGIAVFIVMCILYGVAIIEGASSSYY